MINSSAPLILSSEEYITFMGFNMTHQLALTLILFLISLSCAVYIIKTRNKHYKEFCERLDRDVDEIKKDMDK